jgi:hypothetical protein
MSNDIEFMLCSTLYQQKAPGPLFAGGRGPVLVVSLGTAVSVGGHFRPRPVSEATIPCIEMGGYAHTRPTHNTYRTLGLGGTELAARMSHLRMLPQFKNLVNYFFWLDTPGSMG